MVGWQVRETHPVTRKCDEIVFRLQNIFIACGQMVGVYSEQLDIDREIRVTKIKGISRKTVHLHTGMNLPCPISLNRMVLRIWWMM